MVHCQGLTLHEACDLCIIQSPAVVVKNQHLWMAGYRRPLCSCHRLLYKANRIGPANVRMFRISKVWLHMEGNNLLGCAARVITGI